MNIGSFLFGSESKVESKSTLSPEQQELLSKVSKLISTNLGSGASTSKYPAYTATPSLMSQAFSDAGSLFGTGQQTIIDALTKQAAGVPSYTFDPGKTATLWNQDFATPMMNSWSANVAPVVAESYNVPGMARSTLTARGVTDAANRYFAESVQPSLWNAYQTGMNQEFQAGESAANRQVAGAAALGQLPSILYGGYLSIGGAELTENERILAALRGEESRMFAENNPWLQSALGLSTASTVENVGFQGEQGNLGNILKALAALAA